MRTGWISLLLLLPAAAQDRVTVRPPDHGRALSNPGMGWNYAYFTDNQDARYGGSRPIDDTLDWFPGVTAAYFRTGWARIEPEEGKYNWDYTDRVAAKWIAAGKQVAYSWIVFSTAGSGPAAPQWLKDAGAKGWTWQPPNPAQPAQWIPNWDDPVFLEKLETFAAAAAARYDGQPHVQFIEPGSLGTWGEGHTWTGRGSSRTPEITLETQKKHIDIWRRHFKRTPLLINDDYNQAQTGGVEYAFQQGYGVTDWSIMVQDAKPYMNAQLADKVWRNQPVGLENEHYGMAYSRTKSWHDGSTYLDALERYHASFLRIHWWPDEFLNGNGRDLPGNRDLVQKMNRRVGYRLQVVEASWPATLKVGESTEIAIAWRNAGVAPCYRGGHPAIWLVDAAGRVAASKVDERFNVRALEPGPSVEQAPPVERTIALSVPATIAPGEYSVCVSVGEPDGTPVYQLPLAEYNSGLRYRLGKAVVAGPNSPSISR